jgi:hypothetical protein
LPPGAVCVVFKWWQYSLIIYRRGYKNPIRGLAGWGGIEGFGG